LFIDKSFCYFISINFLEGIFYTRMGEIMYDLSLSDSKLTFNSLEKKIYKYACGWSMQVHERGVNVPRPQVDIRKTIYISF